jgi:Sulfate permease and related transporters (MFS superfamily)
VYRISGPLFFGAANRLDNLLDTFVAPPKVLILRMGLVPIIDASGVHALGNLARRCARRGIVLVVSGLQAQPNRVLAEMDFGALHAQVRFASDFEHALRLAASLAAHAPGTRGEAQ